MRVRYRELGTEDKRQIKLYGWMLALTVGLLVVFIAGHSHQASEFASKLQAQRRTVVRVTCTEGDNKHDSVFAKIREQRARLAEEPEARDETQMLALRVKGDAINEREETVAITTPWFDCNKRVKLFVH